MVSKEELKDIKNKFKVNHAARMVKLSKAIESFEKTQASEPKETRNTESLRKLNDLLASL